MSRVRLNILCACQVENLPFLGFLDSLFCQDFWTLRMVLCWPLEERERAQLFWGEALVPLDVPLLGSGPICMLLQLLMDVHGVSRSWAQHIWKAVISLILLGWEWGEATPAGLFSHCSLADTIIPFSAPSPPCRFPGT